MLEMRVPRHPSGSGEYFFVFFHDIFHFLLLHGEALCKFHGCGCGLVFTLRVNHEEENFPSLGNNLPAFLRRDEINNGKWSYL
jgi:hypothetical protein